MYRWRRGVLASCAVSFAVSLAVLARGGSFSTNAIRGTEAERALALVAREIPDATGVPFTIIFHDDRRTARDPAFRDAVEQALGPARAHPRVLAVETPYTLPGSTAGSPGASSLVSPDGHDALALVTLRGPFKAAARAYPSVAAAIRSDRLALTFTGPLAFHDDIDRTLASDLRRAELLAMPLALLVLLLTFRTLAASILPLAVGGLAVAGGVAAVLAMSHVADVARYALNVVSLVGLGVAIDDSLFIVSRFREALDRGASVEDAVAESVATAGRSVLFSGLAVMLGLCGLLLYRGSYLVTLGLAGAIVVALAVVYSLTFLPALLSVLGPSVERGRLLFLRRRDASVASRFWSHVATRVMRRPVPVLLATLGLLLAAGSPVLRLRTAASTVNTLPPSVESRRGDAILRARFPDQAAASLLVVVEFPSGPALRPDRVAALDALSRRIAALPDVARVDSVLDLDRGPGRTTGRCLLFVPPAALPAPLAAVIARTVGERIVLLAVHARPAVGVDEARALVREVRRLGPVGDGRVLVTGAPAIDLDTNDYIFGGAPKVIAFVMGTTFLLLVLLLGSLVLPLKAVAMNLLSIAGSFGALVWIFQEGHLHGLLGFTPGPVDPSLPAILFCTLFGLSMDYEVLLLSRIHEEYRRTGDNTAAVAEGLGRTGRLITSAAAIMVVVFAAFTTADVVLIKAVGLGMAVAVALDATLVRLLLVPAVMRLFGTFNWWAPGPIARLRRRAGPPPSAGPWTSRRR